MPEMLEGKQAVAHLLRRTGFGPSAWDWSSWAALPYAEAVDRVMAQLDQGDATDPSDFEPYEPGAIQQLWLDRMLSGRGAFAEKLALFWHGHFAASDAKVTEPVLMWKQYALFLEQGAGSFRDLVKGVNRDVAMIRFLDGNSNRSGHANENYGRELQELFTLGIGNYTETDIREVARAFTGWGSRHHDFVLHKQFHDDGEKTIHGQTGNFDGDDVVDILVSLPACPRLIAGKLLRFFSHPNPTKEEVDELAHVMRSNDLDIKKTLAAMLRAPSFRLKANYRSLVRGPTDFVIGALRAAGIEEVPTYVHGAVDRMGQILFRPPSVKGWTSGKGWLSSGAIIERLRVAGQIGGAAPASAADNILEIAFQGDVPETLRAALEGMDKTKRIATVLGGPEFQLF